MDEQDIQLMLALESTKNITHAADRLFVSQSALSKRINALEKSLNVRLLIRSRQGVHFTPEGETVVRHCHNLHDELNNMRHDLLSMSTETHGTLHIGVSINYSLYRLPELLSQFKALHPHVTTYIHTDHSRHLYNKLLLGEVDMAILRGNFAWEGPRQRLSKESLCLIKPTKDYPIAPDTYIARRTDSQFEHQLVQWFYQHHLIMTHHNVIVDNIGTCVQMVQQNLGWAIVPEICLDEFTGYQKKLTFNDGTPFSRSTYIMYSDAIKELRQVQAFLSVLRNIENI